MKTIAERRQNELERFNNEYIHNIETARHIINRFYRLAGLSERNTYLQNNENTCNTRYAALQEEKEERAIDRLNETLKPYGLKLYVSVFPSIVKEVNDCGGIATVYSGIYYR